MLQVKVGLLELKANTFNLNAAVSNGATLHVQQAADNRYRSYYVSNSATSRFPNIVADINGQQTMASGTLGTKGFWTFADGVLTVTYNGAMPTIDKSVTDPEKAFRYKWIDFLSEITEIDVIGKDVEVQPYFLYGTDGYIVFDAKFMGEGTSTAWDKCIFYIDGVEQFTYGARGNGWFKNNAFPVSAGIHTFKWEYTKDSTTNPDGDAFFVDNIYFLQNGKDDDRITGIESLTPAFSEGEGTWFDLSGRKLDSKPTQAGLYIKNGKKVVVK